MVAVYVLLAVVLALFAAIERSRFGRMLRQAGTDTVLAELQASAWCACGSWRRRPPVRSPGSAVGFTRIC